MKKFIALLMIASMLLASCSPADDNGIIEISEESFVDETFGVLGNPDRYLGRTIRLEGMFMTVQLPGSGDEFHFVYRLTDGCCGPEPIGFELHLDGIDPLPDYTWVEVTGVLEQHISTRLEVISLIEMSERGAEHVPQ